MSLITHTSTRTSKCMRKYKEMFTICNNKTQIQNLLDLFWTSVLPSKLPNTSYLPLQWKRIFASWNKHLFLTLCTNFPHCWNTHLHYSCFETMCKHCIYPNSGICHRVGFCLHCFAALKKMISWNTWNTKMCFIKNAYPFNCMTCFENTTKSQRIPAFIITGQLPAPRSRVP